MRKLVVGSLAALSILCVGPVAAAERGTADEAVAMVKKAVAVLKASPPQEVYAAINNKDPRFADRDLYVFIQDKKGLVLAHGSNLKLVGKDASENQDADGKFYVKERMEAAKTKNEFWLDYKFANPTLKKIETKSTYCEVLPDSIVCVGIYKP